MVVGVERHQYLALDVLDDVAPEAVEAEVDPERSVDAGLDVKLSQRIVDDSVSSRTPVIDTAAGLADLAATGGPGITALAVADNVANPRLHIDHPKTRRCATCSQQPRTDKPIRRPSSEQA